MVQAMEEANYRYSLSMIFGFRRTHPSPTLSHGLLLSNCFNIVTQLMYSIRYI